MGPVAAGSLAQIRTHGAIPPEDSPAGANGAGAFEIGQASRDRLRRHRYQRRRLECGQSPLQKGVVRGAECTDLAIGSRQPRRPLDRVITVLGVMRFVTIERLEFSV